MSIFLYSPNYRRFSCWWNIYLQARMRELHNASRNVHCIQTRNTHTQSLFMWFNELIVENYRHQIFAH